MPEMWNGDWKTETGGLEIGKWSLEAEKWYPAPENWDPMLKNGRPLRCPPGPGYRRRLLLRAWPEGPVAQIYPLRAWRRPRRVGWLKLVFWSHLSSLTFLHSPCLDVVWTHLSSLTLCCLWFGCLRNTLLPERRVARGIRGLAPGCMDSVFRCLFHIAFLKVFSSCLPPFWIIF